MPADVWTATGLEHQVFLDHSGRRHRRVATLGVLVVLFAAVWCAGLIAGPVGFSAMPALPSSAGLVPKSHALAVRSAGRRGRRLAVAAAETGRVAAHLSRRSGTRRG